MGTLGNVAGMTRPHGTRAGRRRVWTALATCAALVASLATGVLPATAMSSGSVVASVSAAASIVRTSANPAPDGSSFDRAAASCWEVKQNDFFAPSGVYWLVTPTLGLPQQFYCDQVTDGGGWVLIGRGRENWTQSQEGRLTAADVAETPTGTAAFSPAQLPVETITGLLGGGRVDALAEGVRLRRATNTVGTSWQEVRFSYATPRDRWSWQFAGVQRVGSWSIGTTRGSGGTTGAFGSGSQLLRVETNASAVRGWERGFGFGSLQRGNPSASSYVYARSPAAGYAKPFTQVFLRPRLLSGDLFTPIPDEGLPSSTREAAAESYPEPLPWGVSGLGAGGTGELNTEVADFAVGDGVMYVAGNFRYVQRSATGLDRTEQSYLAAFDAVSGEWISTFRPVLNNQVKAVEVLPDGRVAIGGAFTSANAVARSAFAVLDPVTGETDGEATTNVVNYVGSTPPLIRAMDVQDGFLYIGGRFTHASGSGVTNEVYMRNLGRLDAATLAPQRGWAPTLDGTVMGLDASERGDRVYAAGFFSRSGTTNTLRAAAYTADTAAVVPWSVLFSATSANYQQAVREVGDRVWLGGSQHMLFSYDRETMAELSTNITETGGDFQAISGYGPDVAAGCHCYENVYVGARTYLPSTGFTQVEHIEQAGIWRGADGSYVPEFSPQLTLRVGHGVWAIEEGPDGALWLGGDLTHARRADESNRWTGGFVKFAARQTGAPDTPGSLAAVHSDGVDTLTWDAAGDAVGYAVMRGDRVVAVAHTPTIHLPAAAAGARYFVATIDHAGMLSASTPVAVAVEAEEPPQPVDVLQPGAPWSYWFQPDAPAPEWRADDYDVSAWPTGDAPFGWGHAQLGTTLTIEGTKPVTSYYRRSFEVQDATRVEALTLTTRADDGIVVYVNGVEAGRANMPEGAIGHTTFATAAPNAATALANPVTLSVPGWVLRSGPNTVTAQVHSNYRSTPSASFELTGLLSLLPDGAPPTEPPPGPAQPVDVIVGGSDWAYSFAEAAPDPEWAQPAFDAAQWPTGIAPLGWGHTNLGTTLSIDGPKPLTSYFRRVFEVQDVDGVDSLTLTTRADDGLIVFVNGVEVGRRNLPDGAVGHTTHATAAPNAATALANPVVFEVPASALVTGTNLITAEVHSNYRNTPSASFELAGRLTLTPEAGEEHGLDDGE